MKSVKRVCRNDCGNLVLRVHYAKRWPSISYAFGLFEGDEIIGCVTFGTPPSSPLRVGLAGRELAGNILELNRLVLKDNVKNEASFLVSKAMRLLSKCGNFIVVSFADTSQGHVGTVYQASNFGYYGLSAKRTDWKVRGKEHLHGQTIADEFRGLPNRALLMREKYGDDFYLSPRPRKHRYIKVVGSRGFRAMAKRSIKYKEMPYPHLTAQETTHIDSNTTSKEDIE